MVLDYEVTYILRPNLEENEVGERTGAIGEQLKGNGGEVVGTEILGKKRLAYEINDVREGIYTVMRFRATAEAAHELERQLGLNEDVMRALLIRLDKHALAAEKAPPRPEPPVSAERERFGDRDRGDRGYRGDREQSDRSDRGDRDR